MMNKKRHKRIGFFLTLAIPLIILLGMTVKPLWTLNFGEDISLLTIPVDPRDLLYGDYVSLRYEIEEVPKSIMATSLLKKVEKEDSYRQKRVYGKLAQQGDIYVLDELTDIKPASGIYLTGKIDGYSYKNTDGFDVHSVNFGLERYFVPENTGKALEDLSRKGQLVAHLKVKNGYALLRGIEEHD